MQLASRPGTTLSQFQLFLFFCAPHAFRRDQGRRTLSILAPADLDELFDIGNFGRHLDGYVSRRVGWDYSRVVKFVGFLRETPGLVEFSLVERSGCYGAESERCWIGNGGVTTSVA